MVQRLLCYGRIVILFESFIIVGNSMKINNGFVLCFYCGCLSVYYEIDWLVVIREKVNKEGGLVVWDLILQVYKKKVFCLMCYKFIDEVVIGQLDVFEFMK